MIWDLASSYWNVIFHKLFILNISMNSRRYWSRMMIYYSFLIESSINAIDLNLLPIKHLHIICNNSSSRFFVIIFFDIYFFTLFWCFHIHIMRVSLFFWIVNSLDHIIITQFFIIQYRYTHTHYKYFLIYSLFNNILFNAFHFWISFSLNLLWMIYSEIEILIIDLNSFKNNLVFINIIWINHQLNFLNIFFNLLKWERL